MHALKPASGRPRRLRVLDLLLGCAAASGLALSTAASATGGAALPGPDAGSAQRAAAPRVLLQLQRRYDGIEAVAVNQLAGPVEVMLRATSAVPAGVELPVRATVRAGGRAAIARLPASAAGLHLQLDAVPGLPHPRVRNADYLYPLRDVPVRVTQSYGGGFSHTDAENRHAVDFAVEPGVPVLAARDGLVMQVEAGANSRVDPRTPHDPADDRIRGNFIRILHDDGTMALYAHLQYGGVVVSPGTRVRRGTVIGFSGNTGLTSGPHLHFVVQANHGMHLQSLPFRMTGPDGPLRFAPVHSETRIAWP